MLGCQSLQPYRQSVFGLGYDTTREWRKVEMNQDKGVSEQEGGEYMRSLSLIVRM